MSRAIVLFAHGARDPRWAEPFEAVGARLRVLAPSVVVAHAYLEFMTPDLPQAGAGLVAAGCATIDIVPLFLGAGGHVRKDLPALVDALRGAHPTVHWRLGCAIGQVDAVIEAMAVAALAMAADDPAPRV